jgi:lysyl-tRNA synthetase class 2
MPCMGAQIRFLSIRQAAAISVSVLAGQSVIFGLSGLDSGRHRRFDHPVAGLPPSRHVLALVLGVALLALTPRLWRGTRTAVALTIAGLMALAALNAGHGRFGAAAVEAVLALMLALGHGAFRLGCSNRPRPAIVCAAAIAWGLVGSAAALSAPVVRHAAGPVIHGVLHHPAGHALAATPAPRLRGDWLALLEVLIGGAAGISVLALRSLVLPAAADNHHHDHEHRAARAIVAAHGSDSLTPFLVRPDKALSFAAGGVLSYRVIGGTAVISADPVAPEGAAGEVLADFRDQARRRGWQIVLWGAAPTHVDAYRRLGLRALCVGEEAFVDPGSFTLEGRAVRKLRQSVHRVDRRGWRITVCDGREIGVGLGVEIERLAERWRAAHPRVHGFAMGMGAYGGELRPDDLYVMARSPQGELGAVMRFATCGRNLSLDTMQRVGDTPNGLNEALVASALARARERGVPEVSLNYAGLAHLIRRPPSHNRLARALTRAALVPLHRRFQMDRLVRFNEKFSPQWRPRYLVYESRAGLPRAIVRVLQAEGYLPQGRPAPGRRSARGAWARALTHRAGPRGPIGESR